MKKIIMIIVISIFVSIQAKASDWNDINSAVRAFRNTSDVVNRAQREKVYKDRNEMEARRELIRLRREELKLQQDILKYEQERTGIKCIQNNQTPGVKCPSS